MLASKFMKIIKPILLIGAALALAASVRAETTVKLSNVHLCCKGCVTGVEEALGKVSGASASCDAGSGTVALTAPDKAAAQQAVDAIVAAGYFGTSSDPAIKVIDRSRAKDEKVKSLNVAGVHLCCGKCVKAVNKALATVPGVTANTAAPDAESFDVTGDFNAKAVFTALNEAGLAGRVGK